MNSSLIQSFNIKYAVIQTFCSMCIQTFKPNVQIIQRFVLVRVREPEFISKS